MNDEMIPNLQPDHFAVARQQENRDNFYVPRGERFRQRPFNEQLRSDLERRSLKIMEKFMDRGRHLLHLRRTRTVALNDINGKNDKFGSDGRNGTNEYSFLEPPSHFANFFASQSIVFWFNKKTSLADIQRMSCTRRSGEDRTLHRYATQTKIFLVRATLHQLTCVGSR